MYQNKSNSASYDKYLRLLARGVHSVAEAVAFAQLKDKFQHVQVDPAEVELIRQQLEREKDDRQALKGAIAEAEKWAQSDFRVKDEDEYWRDR